MTSPASSIGPLWNGRLLGVVAGVLALSVTGQAGAQDDQPDTVNTDTQSVDVVPDVLTSPSSPETSEQPTASAIVLEPGQIHSLSTENLQRIAIGNPDVADLTVVSLSEVLIKAKVDGATNIIVWDQRGTRTWTIHVVDRAPETLEGQLHQLLADLHIPGVSVTREANKVFLVGEVTKQEELDRLEQMLTPFKGVTNLVNLHEEPAAPTPPPDLVKLAVQVLEMSRSDLDKLGVKWSDSVAFTEPSAEDKTVYQALTHFGTSVTRSSFSATLNALVQKNRARILSEPKLVTSSGKEASSFIGLEVPIITATSFGTVTATVSASIEFRKTGVLLKMTPTIVKLADGRKITTVIEAELSDIDDSVALQVPVGTQTVKVPGFKVRKANTEFTTASGESIVIAGLLEAQSSEVVNQVPALGNVPVLGRLFRTPENKSSQREIVVVVTPETIGDQDEAPGERQTAMEHTLAVMEVTPTVQDPTLRYALQIQERIAKAIHYPSQEQGQGMSAAAKLRVQVFRDGTLGQALISKSSGVQSFDSEVLKAAWAQSPYPPFPAELGQKYLWLELPILFRL